MNMAYCFDMWYFLFLVGLYGNCNICWVFVFKLWCEL